MNQYNKAGWLIFCNVIFSLFNLVKFIMNLTKLFALGERKRINDESEKHHNSSTFYQDANYHNQIVNELSEQMWLELVNSPRKMTATNPRGLASKEPLLTENIETS